MSIMNASMGSVLWLLTMLGMTAAYIIVIIAIWRAMKAHESIANTLKDIANNLKSKSS